MPLTMKGLKMRRAMRREYGRKKGDQVFYATENKRKGRGLRLGRKSLSTRYRNPCEIPEI